MARDFDRVGEEYLTILAQSRDAEAFRQLHARIHPRLHNYARSLLGNEHEAADAVQEAWLAIHRKLPQLRDPAAFRTWSFRVVTRRCADLIRKKQRRRKAEEKIHDPSDEPDQRPLNNDEQHLQELIQGLPADHRGLIDLIYYQDLSLHEVAIALDIPLGTVKSRLHYVRKLLKKRLTNNDHETR